MKACYFVNQWKRKDGAKYGRLKWRMIEDGAITTINFDLVAKHIWNIRKIQQLATALNKKKVDPNDLETINKELSQLSN